MRPARSVDFGDLAGGTRRVRRCGAWSVVAATALACGPAVSVPAEPTTTSTSGSTGAPPTGTSAPSTSADSTGTTSTTSSTEGDSGSSTGDLVEPPCPDEGPMPVVQHLALDGDSLNVLVDPTFIPVGGRDVDGDGLDDLVLSQHSRSVIVLGGFPSTAVSVADLQAAGFVREIAAPADGCITSANLAGDVDGDTLADVVALAGRETDCECQMPGEFGCMDDKGYSMAYVLPGSGTGVLASLDDHEAGGGTVMDLSPSTVHSIEGATGRSAGDINDDGLGDFILYRHHFNATIYAGAAGLPASIDPADVLWEQNLGSFHAAGDVDGDGIDDLVGRMANDVWVYGGQGGSDPIARFDIVGANGANSPLSVGAGDINGDGRADLALQDVTLERYLVVFGTDGTDTIMTDAIAAGMGGWAISMPDDYVSNRDVAAVGDVNGDGLADLALLDRTNNPTVRVYVVYGKADSGEVALCDAAVGNGGFGFAGEDGRPVRSVAGAGDLDGDGRAELRVDTDDGVFIVKAPG